jgi:hypothetical protein
LRLSRTEIRRDNPALSGHVLTSCILHNISVTVTASHLQRLRQYLKISQLNWNNEHDKIEYDVTNVAIATIHIVPETLV